MKYRLACIKTDIGAYRYKWQHKFLWFWTDAQFECGVFWSNGTHGGTELLTEYDSPEFSSEEEADEFLKIMTQEHSKILGNQVKTVYTFSAKSGYSYAFYTPKMKRTTSNDLKVYECFPSVQELARKIRVLSTFRENKKYLNVIKEISI